MAQNSSRSHEAVTLHDKESDVLGSAACPMCHTSTRMTRSAIEAQGAWRCVRCGQHWDAARLSAVAAYATWTAEHGRAGRQG